MITESLKKKQTLSFEVFPPKKDGEFEQAYEILKELGKLSPDFISVTYGAGGSRSKKTVEIASFIQNQLHIDALAHMTCVGCKQNDLIQVVNDLKTSNVKHVLALRGDRPKDMSDAQYNARDFAHACDMTNFLKLNTSLHIAGACYPEKHYEASDLESDLLHLKEKQDAGAEFFISQLFFDNQMFYNFMDLAIKHGITKPILPGIMPITTSKQLGTTVSLSGSSVPKTLSDIIAAYGDSPEDMYQAGLDYAIRQIMDLQKNSVNGIHIYTMNKPDIAKQIVKSIY